MANTALSYAANLTKEISANNISKASSHIAIGGASISFFLEQLSKAFNEQVSNIEDVYRVVYVQNKNMTQALKIADIELPNSKEKQEILDFINSETKGIMRGFN